MDMNKLFTKGSMAKAETQRTVWETQVKMRCHSLPITLANVCELFITDVTRSSLNLNRYSYFWKQFSSIYLFNVFLPYGFMLHKVTLFILKMHNKVCVYMLCGHVHVWVWVWVWLPAQNLESYI